MCYVSHQKCVPCDLENECIYNVCDMQNVLYVAYKVRYMRHLKCVMYGVQNVLCMVCKICDV